jgi:Rrf2 family protein
MLTALVGYAATALGYLAQRGGAPVQVRQIARERDIPAPYLAKIIRRLSARGIVGTQRGSGGGVTLLVDPARTTLLDICTELDEPLLERQCILGQKRCDDAVACPGHQVMQQIRELQIDLFGSLTLREIGLFDARRFEGGVPSGKPRPRRQRSSRRPR